MSLVYISDCPHCRIAQAGLQFKAELPHQNFESEHTARFTLIFACPRCHEVIAVTIQLPGPIRSFQEGKIGDFANHLRTKHGNIREIYPRPHQLSAPDGVPARASRCFIEAEDNASRGNYDSAGAMYRKTLDIATKALDDSTENMTLQKRIDALRENGRLTDALQEWAHEIRLDGNEAAHGEKEFTKAEIEQLAGFARFFLTYTFTLPAEIASKRAAKNASTAE